MSLLFFSEGSMKEYVIAIVLLIVGFVLLVKGADWFVDGAAGLAGKARIPTLVIGLTVVAFGTSAPELAVSISSAIQGNVGIAVGNVIGSNITNILLILGLSAIFCVLPVQRDSRIIDFPVLIGASILFVLFGLDGTISRIEGIACVVLLVSYTVFLVWKALRNRENDGGMSALNDHEVVSESETEVKKGFALWYDTMKAKVWFLLIVTVVGLGLVVGGAQLAVDGATMIAEKLGVSARMIGLTVVAIGTSLPELVTSVTAARKGETDIAVGNIVGSNIFNILMVAGLSATIFPLPFESKFIVDGLIALGAAVMLAVFGYLKGNKIRRWSGIVMLAGFALYYVYLLV